jgi:hypothetical protein
MFEALLFAALLVALTGAAIGLDGSRDIFYPLVFIAPMMCFIYFWMPYKLYTGDALERYFDMNQLVFVQKVNVLGIFAFVVGCLVAGVRVRGKRAGPPQLSQLALNRMLIGAGICGVIGLTCWLITIINVGGFVNAYSTSYSGGWDDNGYVRDGTLLLLVGVLLATTALASGANRLRAILLIGTFGFPWLSQALLMARRGPTFAFVVVVLMGWYTTTRKRPPIIAAGSLGLGLGWLVLFLVTNRGSIYLGSNFDSVKTDVSDIVQKPDTGNEYIYGSGTMLAAIRRDHYFWMRRYLAQIMVRPIPSAIWPNKYADFGVPELLNNAGTGEGFADALGWVGAVGSAPGIIADLWVEVSWGSIVLLTLIGWAYGAVWRKAVLKGGPWASQYVLISALSIYLVMQTMEAVIFRTIMLSLPCWITWRWALYKPAPNERVLREARLALRDGARVTHV